MKDGLSDRMIYALTQDNRGFIWACTRNGINSFDGYSFKVYNKEKDHLPFDLATRADVDANGNIWLMGFDWQKQNLYIFDPIACKPLSLRSITGYTDSFSFSFLKRLGNGAMLFGDIQQGKVFTWHPTSGLKKITIPLSGNRLISVTGRNTLWIRSADSKDFFEMDLNGKLLRSVSNPFRIHLLFPELADHGLYLSDSVTKSIFRLTWNMGVQKVDSVLPPQESSMDDFVFNTGIDDITWRQGKLYHPVKGLLTDLAANNTSEVRNYLKAVITDSRGRIWFGNDFGLYMLTITPNKFRQYFYNDARFYYQNSFRNILINNGMLFGANEFKGPKFTPVNRDAESFPLFVQPEHTVGYQTLTRTSSGDIIGLQSKYSYRLSAQKKQWSYYPLPEAMKTRRYWHIHELAPDSFLLGTSKGICFYNINTNNYTPFTKYNAFTDLAQNIVTNILPADKGMLWLCTSNGLYLYDDNKGITARYSQGDTGKYFLPASEFHDMHPDAGNICWIATASGLIKWDLKKNTTRLYSREDGLSNNNIYALYEDNAGHIWMSSDYGIIRLNKVTGKIKTYLTDDGITYNEFNRVSNCRDDSGNIYFGSLNGVTAFNPKDFPDQRRDTGSAPLAVTSFELFNGATNRIENKTEELIKTNNITLAPSDRFFTINFSLLNFSDVLHNTYYWRIEGIDSGWNTLKDPMLRLSGLPYGHMVLRVKAQASDGSWGLNELVFNVSVVKPYYLRTWFLLLASAVLVSLFFAWYKWRINKLERENIRLDEIVKTKTASLETTIEDLKLSFRQKDILMKEIHHRVKNNLQVISTLLNLQLGKIKDDASRRLIEEGISRISSIALMHQQLYRSEDLTSIEFSGFINELWHQVRTIYKEPGQKVILHNQLEETWLDIDTAVPLGLVLNELMTNSFKYAFRSASQGEMNINVSRSGNTYILNYSDNGPGLPDGFVLEKTTSLGMTIISSLAKQLGGGFSYDSATNLFIIKFKDADGRKQIA